MSTAKITRCRHYFHGVCLRKWLYVQDRCPLCHEIIMHQEPAATEKQPQPQQPPAPNAAATPTPAPVPAAAPVVAPVAAATAAAAPVPTNGLPATGAADESDSPAEHNVPHVSVDNSYTSDCPNDVVLCCRTMTRPTVAAAWKRRRRRCRRPLCVGTRTPAADRRTSG